MIELVVSENEKSCGTLRRQIGDHSRRKTNYEFSLISGGGAAFDYVTCHGRRVSPYLRKGLVQRGRKKARVMLENLSEGGLLVADKIPSDAFERTHCVID